MHIDFFQILRDFQQGTFTQLGNSLIEFLGYSNAEDLLTFLHPDDRAKFNSPNLTDESFRLAHNGNIHSLQFKRADGTWLRLSYTEVVIETLPTGVAAKTIISLVPPPNNTDIEKSLYESKERFRVLAEASFGGIGIHDKGKIIEANHELARMTGYAYNELIGMDGLLLIAPDSRAMVMGKIVTGYEMPYESIGLRKDGTTYQLEIQGKQVPYNGKVVRVTEFRNIEDRKRSEETIRVGEERLRAIVEFAVDGILLGDSKGVIVGANMRFLEISGLHRNEILGKHVSNLFTSSTLAEKPLRFDLLKEGKAIVAERELLRPDGTFVCIEMHSKMMPDGSYQSIIRDVSKRKEIEAALKQSEERLRMIIDATNDAIWDWNAKGPKSYFSDNYYTMLGYAPGEFESGYDSWRSLVHPDDIKWVEILSAKCVKENQSEIVLDFRMRMKNGEYKWIHSKGRVVEKDSNGNPVRIIGIHEDITERKTKEDEVKLERAYFEQLFESSPEGVVILDVQDKVLRCNREFTKIFGYTNEEVIGRQINDLIVPRNLADEGLSLTHLVAKGKQIMRETIRMRKDGSSVHVSILGKPIHFEGGQIAVYGIYRDISDRKQVEEELVRKNYEIEAQNEEYRILNEELHFAKEKAEESDRLKSAFLANMSHEVRTPMNGIIGFTQLLANSSVQQPEFNQYLGVIESCGNQLLTIINDLIDISKIEANQLTISETEVNINQLLLKQHLLFLQKANGLRVNLTYRTSLPDDACTVLADGARLQQVLSNLIGNALKFTIKGSVAFGYIVKSNKIEFFVKDTGIGIPKVQQSCIFERFRQVDNPLTTIVGGTGLGLAISKALVNLMGGDIAVESEPDVGSIFSFTIPYKPAFFSSTEALVLPETEGVSIPKGKRVLVAEDDEFNYMYVRELLNELNVEHVRVVNGVEAYDAVVNDSSINLLLLDLKMPVMDGYEATRKIRQVNTKIPIIAQTAYAFSSDREKSLHAGCNDYISKPIDRKEFERLLAKYLK